MATTSINDLTTSQKYFKLPLELCDKLYSSLNQATALICVANGEDFLYFDKEITRDYLFILQNQIVEALEIYQQLEKALTKQSAANS